MGQRGVTIKEILSRYPRFLEEAGIPNARTEIEIVLTSILEISRWDLYLNFDLAPGPQKLKILEEAFLNRLNGVPLQYITGEQGFRRLQLMVREGVFIPRPETELLVEEVLTLSREITRPLIAADVGTGSGAIALSLAQELGNIHIFALDSSPLALKVARKNAALNGLEGKITFKRGNMLEALPSELFCTFDLIVSNPPYIPSDEIDLLPTEVRFEPREALDGGEDGLEFYHPLATQAFSFLKSGGILFVEIGHSSENVVSIFEKAGFQNIRTIKDLRYLDRIVLGCK